MDIAVKKVEQLVIVMNQREVICGLKSEMLYKLPLKKYC